MCRHAAWCFIFLFTWRVTSTLVDKTSTFLCVGDGHCYRKCCPNGYVLNATFAVVPEVPVCTSADFTLNDLLAKVDYDVELYKSNCEIDKLVVKRWIDSDESHFWPLCIEHLAPNPNFETNQSNIARVFCEKDPTSSFATFKKCCKQGYKYDLRLHTCLPVDSDDFDVVDFIGDVQFDAIVLGMPDCGGVLVDFTLNDTTRISAQEMESGEVCVDRIFGKDNALGGRRCENVTAVCEKIPCVLKCCPPGKHFPGTKCSKTDTERGFNPTFYNVTNRTNPEVVESPTVYGIGHVSFSDDRKKFRLRPRVEPEGPKDYFYLLDNGSLYVPSLKANTFYQYNEFCIEDIHMPTANISGMGAFIYFRKVDQMKAPANNTRFKFIAVGLSLSCLFLLATLSVYLCLPALQNLHGMTLMCHVTSFLVAYVCLAMAQLRYGDKVTDVSGRDWRCVSLAYVLLFSLLAAFAWMNIMCFDIWWTIGGVRSVQHVSRKKRERKRFAWYSLYAWGIPTTISSIALIVDNQSHLPDWVRPRFGVDECWFSHNTEVTKLIYFIGPIALLICCNLVLFILTARSCSKVKAEINRMQKTTDDGRKKKYQADINKVMMNGKLFVVMGISWVIELVGLLVKSDTIWFVIPDAVNALQGVFIFIIFVMKRKVLLALRERFGCHGSEKHPKNKANVLLGGNRETRKSSMSSTCFTATTATTGTGTHL